MNIPVSPNPTSNIPCSSQSNEIIELDENIKILVNLPKDHRLRPRMIDYKPNYHKAIRRHYLQKGPCQPKPTKCKEKL